MVTALGGSDDPVSTLPLPASVWYKLCLDGVETIADLLDLPVWSLLQANAFSGFDRQDWRALVAVLRDRGLSLGPPVRVRVSGLRTGPGLPAGIAATVGKTLKQQGVCSAEGLLLMPFGQVVAVRGLSAGQVADVIQALQTQVQEGMPSGPQTAEPGERPVLAQLILKALEGLPAREAIVVRRHFALSGDRPVSLSSLARELGLSPQRVSQIKGHAIDSLAVSSAGTQLALALSRIADSERSEVLKQTLGNQRPSDAGLTRLAGAVLERRLSLRSPRA
jgi:hypothetical protein